MIRWLIPALLVPMLIAGACRGGQGDSSVEQVDETITQSVVSGMALDPFDSTESDPAVGQLAAERPRITLSSIQNTGICSTSHFD